MKDLHLLTFSREMILFFFVLLFTTEILYAQDYQISANGSQSVMACITGEVYAWGCNGESSADGRLGVGDMSNTSIYRPTKVNMPAAAGKIQHVDGSSGAFLLAINCDGEVWIWGDNGSRQCGNTNATETIVKVPVYLMSGESNPSNPTAKLSGVKAISGGAMTGYAITSDNRLLAWGNGSDGRIGNGSTSNQNLPVYVKTNSSTILENVIMVDGGDNTCYCLVDDDGDGFGTVYSFGRANGCMLGRDGNTSYALPIVKADGTPLDNIVDIAAGDVHGTAIDKDGYVWVWGNNWGGCAPGNNYATIVEGGETGEPYLQAKSIAGGNGFNMAVTLDGHLVTWGCNGATDHSGGNLGNGTTTNSPTPVYVRVSSTMLLDNVATVSRGNAWGFARKNDNSIWTWGSNKYGVLGIGSSAANPEVYARELNLNNITCGLPDMKPTATLPPDFTTCINDGWSYELVSGPNSGNMYQFTWYKNGVEIAGATAPKITVTEAGTYSVRIHYIGNTYPCANPPDAVDEVTITEYQPEFSVPTNIEFCGDEVEVHVNGSGIYDLYTSSTGGAYLGRVKGGDNISVAASSIIEKSGDNYTLYVEEVSTAAGVLNPSTEESITTYESHVPLQNTQLITLGQLTASENLIIDSVDVYLFAGYNVSSNVTAKLALYTSTGSAANSPIAESETFSKTLLGTNSTNYVTTAYLCRFKTNFSLGVGPYYLGFSSLSGTANNYFVGKNGSASYPYVDNSNGTTLVASMYTWYGNEKTDKDFPFYNIYFHAAPKYCKRMPMTVKSKCSCNEPDDITISSSQDYLCPNGKTTLTTNNQADATTFDFTWYSGTDVTGTPLQGPDAGKNSSLADVSSGTYTVLVRDIANPTSCQKSQEITITEKSMPAVVISNSGKSNYCFGETVTPPTFTFTGTAPFEFTYTDGINAAVTETSMTATFSPTAPSAVGEYTYKVTALNDAYCSATTSSLTSTTAITIKNQPKITSATTTGSVCAGNPLSVSCVAENATGATYSWSGPNSFTSANADATITTSATTAHSGVYEVTVSLDGCSDSKSTDNVTIYPIPEITSLVASPTSVCSGETVSLEATVSDNGDGLIQWTGVTATTLSASLQETVTTDTEKEISLHYESVHSCAAVDKQVKVNIHPYPQKPMVTNTSPSACIGDSPIAIEATPATGATLIWYDENNNVLSSAPTVVTTSETENIFYVSQKLNGCEGPKETITAKVNGNLSPMITADKNAVCSGGQITLGLDDSYYTQVWNDGGVGYLSSTTIKEPIIHTENIDEGTIQISVTVTNAQGCSGTANKTLTVYPLPIATLTATSNSICNLTSTTITASPSPTGGTGTWTNATKIDDVSATFTACEVKTETISYSYVSPDGCTIAIPATTTVTVNAIPGAPTTKDVKYCQNDESQTLTATATGTLTWYDADKNPLASAPKPSTSSVGSTTYYVTQTENNCESDYASIKVTVNELPKPVISASKDEVCEGSPITLSLDKTYASQTWTCTPTNVLNSTTLASPTIQGTAEAGTYSISVFVKNANECEGVSESKTIEIFPIPQATLSDLAAKCESESDPQTITAEITPAGTSGEGTWNDKVTKLTEYTASFTPSVAKKGTHTVTYDFVSDKGCPAAQVSKTVEVYALPEITLAPSQTEVCKGGNNSDVVTMRTTGTAATGTFAYSSTTLTTLDATNGSFDPKNENAETHTITLLYTDEHSCQDTKQTTVKINARPVADVSMNRTDICDYAPSITLTAKVDGNETTGGTFAGTGVTASSFSPSTAGAGGPYTITYNYTDATTQCSAEETSFSIDVHHTDAPAVTSASESKLNVTNQASVPTLNATGPNIKWYLTNDTTATVVATTNDYQHTYVDDGGYMAVNQYAAFATQTENGCQSVPAEAILTITDCSVTAPTAVKYHACVSESGNGIEVTATSTYTNPDTENNFGWFYDRTQIPSTTVPNLVAANPDGIGVKFTIPQSKLTAEGTVTVYVAEYDGTVGTQCFSPTTAVTVEVHALPVPVIDDPGMICSGASEMTITYTPGTGATLSGTGVSGDKWTPQFDASIIGVTTTTLTLDAEKTWGTGTDVTATCSASTTLDVKVTNVLAPTGTGIGTEQLWSIGSIASLPAMEVSYASDLGATLSVKDSTLTEISSASPMAMYPRISEIGTYKYAVTQTLNGCTSPVAVSTYKIVECPTPTPNPDSKQICAGENLPSLNANGIGTPSYEWIDSVGVTISTSGTLDVSTLSGYGSEQGTYTFKVRQNGLDAAGNECWGGYATATVTIHPLPEIAIEDIPVQCYDGGDYEVVATVDGIRSSNGTWTIDNATDGVSSSGIISPAFKQNASDGDYTVKYEYTNPTTNCSNFTTKQFHVEYVEIPIPVNHTGIITDPKPVQVSVSDIEQDAEYNWYAGQSSTDVLSSDIPFVTDDNPETIIEKSYWVSKSVSGCESGRAEAIVQIVDCPFPAPEAASVSACVNGIVPELSATTSSTVVSWKWYDSEGNDLNRDSEILAHGVSSAIVDTVRFSVSYIAYEPISQKNCESPKKNVEVVILPLPEITFSESNPSMLCYGQGDAQLRIASVDYHKNGVGSGEWSVDDETGAVNATTGIFNSDFNGEKTASYTVRYTYTDGANCQNSSTMPLMVQYVPAPTLTSHYSMTTENKDAVLSAELETGATVRWYTSETVVTSVSSDNPWTTGDKGDEVVSASYYASQVLNGCESKRTETSVQIVSCPVPAPVTIGAEMCDYDDVPELTAVLGDWTGGMRPTGEPEVFRLYDSNGNFIEENTTGTFVPNVNHTQAELYTFFVTEWNPNTTPVACESPKVPVTLQVRKTPSASIIASQESVCEAPEGMNPEMTVVGYSGQGDVFWYEEDPNYPVCDGLIKGAGTMFMSSSSTIGENKVWMMIKENNCYSEPASKSFVIKAIPDAPAVTPASVCEGQSNTPLTATPSDGGYISWYLNASRSNVSLLKINSSSYTPIDFAPDVFLYYATQTVDGCQSAAAEVTYTIKPIPSVPTITFNTYSLCVYDNPPVLTAEGTNVQWYMSDQITMANTTDEGTHLVTDMSMGKHSYYASQTIDGCEGPQANVVFYVNPKPTTPITTSKTMCEGDDVIPTLQTNLSSDNWYADRYATAFLTTGSEYTPEHVGSEDVTYYILREQNGCHSDTALVSLHIIHQPTFEIDSSDLVRCFSDPIQELHAINLDEDYHTNESIEGVVRWYFNKRTTEGDSYLPDSSEFTIGKNSIYVQYFVTREGTTCASKQKAVKYDIHNSPRRPLLGTMPICIGEYLHSGESAEVPIFSLDYSIIWSSPVIDNGAIHESRKIKIPNTMLEQFSNGYIPVTVTAIDKEINSCTTTIADSVKVSGMPDATIVGNTHVCEDTESELYYVQNPEPTSHFDWDFTGSSLIYTKNNENLNIRYIDWQKATIDTIAVTVTSEDLCVATDTMVVYVAPKPIASFVWELPGASNVIELTNTSTQDSLWYTDADGEQSFVEIPYTMYWNYGHIGENTSVTDVEVPYNERNYPLTEDGYVYGYNCPILKVVNEYGCESTYTECIFININSSLYVPTAFSPSNPAHSVRTFQPKGFNLAQCNISVYDKWGNLVWYSDKVEDGIFEGEWDGTCNGKMMASGVYIWKMEATFLDGQVWEGFDGGNGKKVKFGNVLLIR